MMISCGCLNNIMYTLIFDFLKHYLSSLTKFECNTPNTFGQINDTTLCAINLFGQANRNMMGRTGDALNFQCSCCS